jgi:hypothetical protein
MDSIAFYDNWGSENMEALESFLQGIFILKNIHYVFR